MSEPIWIIQFEFDEASLAKLDNRERNQLVGCMHAHNELTILNRLLLFSATPTGEGELHDASHSIQQWCILQMLAGKLYQTWQMLFEGFCKASPEDPALVGLQQDHKASLLWLRGYFKGKTSPVQVIRDQSAFHYDKRSLGKDITSLGNGENRIWVAEHPANALYFLGSSFVFRRLFTTIANNADGATGIPFVDRTAEGFEIANNDVSIVNLHMNQLLYGLIRYMLENSLDKSLDEIEQLCIPVEGAPDPDQVALPTFIDIRSKRPLP